MMKRISFIIGLFLCVSVPGAQGDPTKTSGGLFASLDPDSAGVGAIIRLIINYSLPEGAHLPVDPVIKGLEDVSIIDRRIGSEQIIIRLLVDRLGSWKTGRISLSYVDRGGRSQSLTTDPVSLTILSNLGEKPAEAQLRAIQGILPAKPLWLKYLPWAAGLTGILLAVLSAFWWYKQRHKQKGSSGLQYPPHILALKEMEQLEAQGFFEKGYVKEFYFGFSEILRHYLESTRNFPAAEFTTEEIAHYLDNEQDRKLLPLLRQADLIKFADTIPTTARKEEDVKEALSYIHETAPGPPENGRGSNALLETPG